MSLTINLPPHRQDDILLIELRWYGEAISPELLGWNLLYSSQWGRINLCGWWCRAYSEVPVTNPVLPITDPEAEYEVQVVSTIDYDAVSHKDLVC